MYRAFGTALSRAKAQSWREAVATTFMVAMVNMRMTQTERPVPPLMDEVACVKISMNGYPFNVVSVRDGVRSVIRLTCWR